MEWARFICCKFMRYVPTLKTLEGISTRITVNDVHKHCSSVTHKNTDSMNGR
jgi:hypothetical protein